MVPASCSKCHRTTEIEVRQSINVALDPQLKARVKDGSLFLWECPCCGQRNLARYQTLYHDPEAKLMVWLLPGDAQPPQAVEDAVKELEDYTLREMCKWVTRRELAAKNPAAATASLKFLRMEGADNELVMAFPLNGQMQVVNVGFNVYEDARGILLRNPAIRPDAGFAEVDAAWIEQFFR